jgi:hypothetical protein
LDRRVEPEGDLGAGQVIVDRLGHADHREVLSVQLVRCPQRVVTADGDHGVEFERPGCGQDAVGPVFRGERVGAGRSEDGPAPGQNGPARPGFEPDGLVVDQAAPAVEYADALVAMVHGSADDDGSDHCVEAGTVTTTGE